MRNKPLWITSILFFLIVQTVYFWEGKTGIIAIPITLALCITFLVLFFFLMQQIVLLIKDRFKEKRRLYLIFTLTTILILTLYFPSGMIDFEKFEGKDLLIAGREGAANCRTIIKLKENGKFYEKITCFGIETITGRYYIKNDTIFFTKNNNIKPEDRYEFAIIGESKLGHKNDGIFLYKTKNDTLPNQLTIIYNKLIVKMPQKPNTTKPID